MSQISKEARRLDALLRSGLLDIESDETFASLVDVAADRLRAPMSTISLIDSERQIYFAKVGICASSTSRSESFCTHTVELNEALVIPDTFREPRWRQSPLVTGDPHVRFYAGIPISFEGLPIGTLCVLDTEPREGLLPEERLHLERYAALASELLELRALRVQSQTEVVRFRQMAETSPDPMLVGDREGRVLYWNAAAERLFGYRFAEAGQLRIDELIVEEALASKAGLRDWISRALGHVRDIAVIDRRRVVHRMEASVSRWLEDGKPVYGAVLRDVSERRERETALLDLAHRDPLTGLPNRSLLRNRLEEWLADGPVSVLLVDLDGFKDVNDTIGNAAGDEVLRGAAERLLECVRGQDIVARIGGDEFVVALPQCGDPLAASGIAKRIVDAMEQPFLINDRVVSIGASVGIALAPSHAEGIDELLFCADLAVYKAKKDGRHRHRLYTPTLRAAVSERQRFVHEFHRAIEREEFVLHYQPQVRLKDGALLAAEALIRWQHPEHGLLQPAAFLPALLSSRHAVAVNDWVLRTACRQAAAWLPFAGAHFRIGVNACARRLHGGEIAGFTADVLAETGLPPDNLELEITETAVLAKEGISVAELRNLRERGVGIALDDFGTGYASLSLLEHCPLTRLKIDRSFVQKMNERPDVPVIRAILQLAKGFGLQVVAEGIETEDQMSRLARKGCAEGQGYLFSRPVPADVLATRFLSKDAASGRFVQAA
ncbi:putative bifunctional diguanylate cyclase/phosphodiesterase [Methylobacterium komagatae]|uniref:Bifunctional diguanylate cyclase/phosphodiesterase n=1 Tax=Methylobacterium komagatae TaxID=374425 RepID=A0ABW2BFR3_9HYPH